MSELNHDETIQPHGTGHGVVDEHPDTTFEGSDASVGMVIGSLAVIALTLVITAIVTFPIQNLLKTANPLGNLPSPLAPERIVPPAPRIEVHPWEVLPELRKHEQAVLSSSGNNTLGQAHIPIEPGFGAGGIEAANAAGCGAGPHSAGRPRARFCGQSERYAGALSGH